MRANVTIAEALAKKDEDEPQIEDEHITVPIRVVSPFYRRRDPITPSISRFEGPSIETASSVAPKALFSDEVQKIPLTNFVPPPTNTKQRDPTLVPFRSTALQRELRTIHDPEETKLRITLYFGFASLVFAFCFILFPSDVWPMLFLVSFGIALIGWFAAKKRKNVTMIPNRPTPFESSVSVGARGSSPSAIFAKPPKKVETESLPLAVTSMNLHRPFVQADRATASIEKSSFTANDLDQLASETLNKLGMTSTVFNKYLSNFKAFVSKTVLAKLAQKLHSEEPLIESMLSVPNFEHCRAYILNRIKTLAASQFLASHFGDRGDRWYDRDWTTDLPSDNQLVLHILSVWLSYFMCGRRSGRVQLVFHQKHLFIKRDPQIENEDDIILCSDDYSSFYVYTKYKSPIAEKFYAFPGRDAMYSGLVLLFWFIKEKQNFLLEGADLTESPMCMDRVFSLTRLE